MCAIPKVAFIYFVRNGKGIGSGNLVHFSEEPSHSCAGEYAEKSAWPIAKINLYQVASNDRKMALARFLCSPHVWKILLIPPLCLLLPEIFFWKHLGGL
jgi:hypothetical protein